MRDGFIIHEKTLKQMTRLSREDVGLLMECMAAFYFEGVVDVDAVANESVAVAVILDDVIERMNADAEAYNKSVEQRRQAAQKRWEKNTETVREDANSMREDEAALREGCESDAKNAVSVSVSDSVSVIKENYPTDSKRKVFRQPTVDEVREYCTERHNNVDAQQFVDFYASKGWKVGNTPMKDWKACVRTWERRKTPTARSGTKFSNFPQREDTDHKALVAKLIAMQN